MSAGLLHHAVGGICALLLQASDPGPTPATTNRPGYGSPLTITNGVVYRVSSVAALQNACAAVNDAGVPATILVANGTYTLTDWALPITCNHVLIRSATGNRDAVIIRGPDTGPDASVEHVFWVTASHVTIADMTFGWCRYHGIQLHGQTPYDAAGLWVHNCRIVNCNEQFIKGTSAESDPVGATDGLVENCLFEFTSGWAYQAYTGGIDVHKAINWRVRDNLFRNIRATDGLAEHAIHFWKRCSVPQNVVVERNIVINCDRGIGFGLGTAADGHNGGTSAIRNNMVYNNGAGANTDVGIGLESANNVVVDNNTVYIPTYTGPIEYRYTYSSNLWFRNNLANRAILRRDSAPVAKASNNVATAVAAWFVAATNGDLHVVAGTTSVIDRGMTLTNFTGDIDGQTRPQLSAWDVGADEYKP